MLLKCDSILFFCAIDLTHDEIHHLYIYKKEEEKKECKRNMRIILSKYSTYSFIYIDFFLLNFIFI